MATGVDAAQRARDRLQALNNTPTDQAERAAQTRLATMNTQRVTSGQAPVPINQASIDKSRLANINNIASTMGYRAPTPQAPVRNLGAVSSSSRSSGGGRKSGGGAVAPKFSQAQLDWAASLLQGGRPKAETANVLDLPDYQGMAVRAFDPTMFNQARTAFGEGLAQDTATAQGAQQNMLNFLNSNYKNAFAGGPQTTMANAPGMDQTAMGRMLQGQGVNAYENPQYQQTLNEGRQSDAGLSSLFAALGAGEDTMQRNRQANAMQYGQQAQDSIRAAGRAGNLGLDLGQGQAQAQWQQSADERAYQDYQAQQQVLQQEAMQNWQRQNQVQDVNTQNVNSYNNSSIQALLGLLPQITAAGGGLHLPTLQSLGLA